MAGVRGLDASGDGWNMMGHGDDFGEELAANQRLVREAAGGGSTASRAAGFHAALSRHVRLLRDHVLPALSENVPGGARVAALDSLLLDSLESELAEPADSGAGADPDPDADAVLARLVEAQFEWEFRTLLPLLEAETTWVVLDDLADQTRRAR